VSDTSTADALSIAHDLCEKHGGIYFKRDTDNVWDASINNYRYPPCWKVFRKLPGGRSTYLGKRRDPAALLRYIRSLI
jgi:hypothetical protein